MLDITLSQIQIRFKYPLTYVLHFLYYYVNSSFKMSNTCITPLTGWLKTRIGVKVLDIFSFATFGCLTPPKWLYYTFLSRSVRIWQIPCLTCITPPDSTPQDFQNPLKLKCKISTAVLKWNFSQNCKNAKNGGKYGNLLPLKYFVIAKFSFIGSCAAGLGMRPLYPVILPEIAAGPSGRTLSAISASPWIFSQGSRGQPGLIKGVGKVGNLKENCTVTRAAGRYIKGEY